MMRAFLLQPLAVFAEEPKVTTRRIGPCAKCGRLVYAPNDGSAHAPHYEGSRLVDCVGEEVVARVA